jgi:hypothetical protein
VDLVRFLFDDARTMHPATPFKDIAYAVEIPLVGLALGTVVLRAWSRLAVKGRLAADDGVLLLGTVRSRLDPPCEGFPIWPSRADARDLSVLPSCAP